MDKILKGVKPGEKISVLDVHCYMPWKHKGEYNNDVLYITYKKEDGTKEVEFIPKPKQEIFFTKPEYKHLWKYTRDSVPRYMVEPRLVPRHKILDEIYDELKDEKYPYSNYFRDIYRKAFETKEFKLKRELQKYPHVFMSDLSIEDSYRINLSTNYNTKPPHVLNKSFMDIETDVYGLTDTESKIFNMDRITAITYVVPYNPKDPKDDTVHCYGLFLRDHKKYGTQKEFEDNIKDFDKLFEKEFNNRKLVVAGEEVVYPKKFKPIILFFDKEQDLLFNFFQIVNALNPDTMNIWNLEFDIPKIYNRMIKLGMDPIQTMSHPKFPKEARYLEMNLDRRPQIDFANRKTEIKLSNTFITVDQMLLYAGMNKGRKTVSKFGLDSVVTHELGLEKRKFKNGWNIINIAVHDYLEFVLYSFNDTILMEILDYYTSHNDTLFIDTQTAACSPVYTTKPTVYTRNYYHLEKINRFDMIPGNNDNTDNFGEMDAEKFELIQEYKDAMLERDEDDDDEVVKEFEDILEQEMHEKVYDKFEDYPGKKHNLGGGIVGETSLNSNNGVELIKGLPSKSVFYLAIDLDYSSEYPWIKYTRNLGKETEIGRLIISKKISDRQDPYNNDIYLPGAEFISDYISHDFLSLGTVYFNLPPMEELIKMLEEELLEEVA